MVDKIDNNMSFLEIGLIRIEDNRLIADGSGEHCDTQYVFLGGNEVLRSLYDNNPNLYHDILDGKVDEVLINGNILLVGPDIFDARGSAGKNQGGINISKRRGIGFYTWQSAKGFWQEVKHV